MIYAVITARKGSERLKNKNMLEIGGKPLAVIAVDTALRCGAIDKVIISTDINELIDMYSKSDDITVLRRPSELAGPHVSSDMVIRQIIESMGMNDSDSIVLLQPTSPLRSSEQVCEAIAIHTGSSDTVISVSNLPDDAIVRQESGEACRVHIKGGLINGAIYIFTAGAFAENGIIPECFSPYLMDSYSGIDIDFEDDYNLARYLYESIYTNGSSKED